MKNKFLQYVFLSCSLMILFSACRKESFKGTETRQAGTSFVYFDAGGGGETYGQEVDFHYKPFTNVITQPFFILRRDAANDADVQKSTTVTASFLDLDAYNTAHETNYAPITGDLATMVPESHTTMTSTGLTFKLDAGVFAIPFAMTINGANFDPAKSYAMVLAITNLGGFKAKHNAAGASLDTLVVTLGVVNQYDGKYHATGVRIHPSLGTLPFDYEVQMTTSGATSVDGPALADLQADLNLTVNPDNSVTATSTYQTLFTPAGTKSTYDPNTKTFDIHVAYNTDAPRIMNIKLVKE
ncbi:MAG: hypothetical protein ACXVJB_04805 [Mucilaginibacter sp.]